ncbi:MAG TPA: ABC transporter substrate-binding protein [Mycobacteriales bacterium]|nr:ABC transporter substrate-binding protein [Mycobacteriales bacterium]
MSGALALVCVGVLSGCGTRLSDSSFQPFEVNPSATSPSGSGPVVLNPTLSPSTGPGITTPLPGQSNLPTSADTTGPGGGPNPTTSSSSGGDGGSNNTANSASDTGVTATSITLCNVTTKGGPFGPYQFTPSYYGAAAYFAALNAQGGIDGRTVRFIGHPDDGSDSGDLQSIHTCIDTDKAFAFVANNIYEYAGAPYTFQKGVPDIGSQPISTYYYQYPNLFSIDGLNQLHNGKPVTANSKAYRWDEEATFFKSREHIKHVGVVFYDQPSSIYGANELIQDFEHAGVKVSKYEVNLGLPNFASAVAQMKADGVDLVADAVDLNGTQKLCQSIEQNTSFESQMKVHLSTISDWAASLGSDLAGTPKCLGKSWSDGYSVNFQDTSNPEVAKFQAGMRQYFPSWLPYNHEWSWEGWIAGMWFTEAAKSCGADLTRKCVISYMDHKPDFGGNGITVPYVGFRPLAPSFYNKPTKHCVSAAQWSTAANGWVARATPSSTCFMVKGYGFNLSPPT